MFREWRLTPALPLLRLVGQLSAAAIFLPLSAALEQTPSCDGAVADFGYIQVSNLSALRKPYCCSWKLLSTFNDTKVSLQLYGFTVQFFVSLEIYDERNIAKRYNKLDLFRTKLLLGRSGTIRFCSVDMSSQFSVYLESINLTSRSQCDMSSAYWWCAVSKRCISIAWRCDKHKDCELGEDKNACFSTTTISSTTTLPNIVRRTQCYTSSGYWCIRTMRCIDSSYRCDKRVDCAYGEDEEGCFSTTTGDLTNIGSSTQSCTSSGYWCIRTMRCIRSSYRCDKRVDCTYGEDEEGCFSTTTGDLTTSMQPTTYACGGLLADSGYIQSPNYPEKYPNGVTCTWQFFSKSSGSNLTLQFETFDIEKNFDYIIIYDERNLSRKYTGSSVPLTVTLGASGWMTFYSDPSVGFSGFRAYFESADVKNVSQCRTSDVYWCASSRRCISVNWYCDGHPDCAIEEDESQCSSSSSNSTTTVAISLPISIVIVVLIVSTVLVILKRRRYKPNHQTDNQSFVQDSSTPAHNPAYFISSDVSAPPSSPALRLSSSDPPLYSDVVNSHQPARPEAEEPPAYHTVCEHGLAIRSQAETVPTYSTSDLPCYFHVCEQLQISHAGVTGVSSA